MRNEKKPLLVYISCIIIGTLLLGLEPARCVKQVIAPKYQSRRKRRDAPPPPPSESARQGSILGCEASYIDTDGLLCLKEHEWQRLKAAALTQYRSNAQGKRGEDSWSVELRY